MIKQQQQSRYRQRVIVENSAGRTMNIAGKDYLNFSSNDYLGLNGHKEINAAFVQGIERYGSSSSSSSLITGYSRAHAELEERLCDWLGLERCLLFTSGFTANLSAIQAFAETGHQLILDKLSHASLIDGAKGQPSFKRFSHNCLTHLEQRLVTAQQNALVATEGVFSMDGDKAPLKQLQQLTKCHQAQLFVDDAHGIGVFGQHGEGTTGAVGKSNLTVMATFGKALASAGAVLGGSAALIEYLVNFCRHYIYSTAMAPAQACATLASIKLIEKESWRREKLKKLREQLVKRLEGRYILTQSESPVIGIILGDEKTTLATSEKLKARGIWLTAIRPPTVKAGTCRLRVTITASHNEQDINDLAESLNELKV